MTSANMAYRSADLRSAPASGIGRAGADCCFVQSAIPRSDTPVPIQEQYSVISSQFSVARLPGVLTDYWQLTTEDFPARQAVSSRLVQVGLRKGRRNLGGRRRTVLSPLQPPNRAFIGLHFLLLQTLDLFLSLLKSRSLSTCHAGSFHDQT